MRKLFSMLFVACFFFSGLAAAQAESIDVYTFKKKRVDQELKGNRGYLMGTAPAPGPRKDKRTIIGIDIELSGSGDDYTDEEYQTQETINDSSKPVTVVSDEGWIK